MFGSSAHILVVDDDSRLGDLLRRYLSDKGFDITVCTSAASARQKLTDSHFDLIVLDVMMPVESGIDFMKSIKSNPLDPAYAIPILMLTAMSESQDRINGLENGAEDYLAKPFEPKELVLRIQNILRRYSNPAKGQERIQLGAYYFDLERGALYDNQGPVMMTTGEANLLKILAMNAGRTLSRDDLAARTGVSLSPRTIDVQVTRLRRKIEIDPRNPLFLQTVRHKGYVLWPG